MFFYTCGVRAPIPFSSDEAIFTKLTLIAKALPVLKCMGIQSFLFHHVVDGNDPLATPRGSPASWDPLETL